MKTRTLIAALLLASIVTPAMGQQQTKIHINNRDGQPRIYINGKEVPANQFRSILFRRARLGVTIDLVASDTDSLGAKVSAVTPGGPAAKAGIQTGDLITRLNGEGLGVRGARSQDEESAPGARLIELAAKLEPNDTVTIEYLRDGRRTTTTLVTEDEPTFSLRGDSFAFRFPEGSERVFSMPGLRFERLFPKGDDQTFLREFRPNVFVSEFGGALHDLELAPLNPDLAAYFGTAEGVLVIQSPESSGLGLKGGDVILGIDGRKPTSPATLLRILRTYEANESITFDIMRLKKRQSITGTVKR